MVTCHVFAETTHVVAAPLGFACVIAPRRSYIQDFIKIRSGGLEPRGGGRNLPFPITLAIGFYHGLYGSTRRDKISYRPGGGNDMPHAVAVRLPADLRPSADESAVHTWLSCRQLACL